MIKILDKREKFSNNIESEFIKIIEDKLNIFFDSCIKNSLTYSYMLAENSRYFSKDSFETMVLSSEQIGNFIQNILYESNNYFYQNLKSLDLNSNIELNTVLIASIKEYSSSLNIISNCENVINKTISKAINLGFSNPIMSYIIKSKSMGSFILGNNNYVNTKFEIRKEIYNQIEGILLNTKCRIKNQLVNYIIRTLKIAEIKSEQELMITA